MGLLSRPSHAGPRDGSGRLTGLPRPGSHEVGRRRVCRRWSADPWAVAQPCHPHRHPRGTSWRPVQSHEGFGPPRRRRAPVATAPRDLWAPSGRAPGRRVCLAAAAHAERGQAKGRWQRSLRVPRASALGLPQQGRSRRCPGLVSAPAPWVGRHGPDVLKGSKDPGAGVLVKLTPERRGAVTGGPWAAGGVWALESLRPEN